MKFIGFLVLCAFGFTHARIPNPDWLEEILPESQCIEDTVFRQGREYRFIYNGQLLTGIPGSSKQHSGTRIQAVCSLIFQSQQTAFFKFTHFRFGKLNQKIFNPREIMPFMAFENVPISEELKEKLLAPVKFTYDRGLLTNVVFDGIEQPWSANIKRGALNLLQVNIQRRDLIETSAEALSFNEVRSDIQPNKDFYRVMERSMEGECETLYTVVSEPNPFTQQPVMNVTATLDFENCRRRPYVKYNFLFSDPCPTCDTRFNSDQKFLKSSSVWKFNISGTPESFMIEQSNVESQYVLVPFNEEGNVVITHVNQTMVLFESGEIKTRIPQLQNPQPSDTQMMYSLDWDIMKEKFFLEGDDEFHDNTPFSQIQNKIEFISSIFRKLVSFMRESVEDPAPYYFDRLVTFCRILKRQEIERIWKKFFVDVPEDFTPEEHKKIQNMIVDAMAFAGTKENVFFLIQKIKSRQIPPFMASMAIKSFTNIRVVSKEMIQELLNLAEMEFVQRHFFLKQSVFLTAGSLMNALCAPNEDFLAVEFKLEDSARFFCPREIKQQFVQILFQKFQTCTKWEDKILFLKTIGNAGIDISIFELEKIIKNVDQQHPVFLRSEAVLALRQLKDIMPRKVQKILMPIFMNRFEAPELRIVSAYQIFQTMPEKPILEQIAKRLFSEPSRQVLSFVFTFMQSMANSTIPCEKRLAEDMKLALRYARFSPFAFMMGYSKWIHKTFYHQKYNKGVGVQFASIFSNTSYFPKHVAFTVNPLFGGFWNKYFATFGFVSEGFENLFWKYFGERGFFFEKPLEEILQRSPRSIKTRSPLQELRTMFESLRIRPREYFPNQPKSFFYLKFKDQEFGFLPFSLESLPDEVAEMFQSSQFNVRAIERFLESGYNFQYHKAFFFNELSFKIPTTIGFPLQFKRTMPTVMSLTGQFKAEFTPQERFHKIKLLFQDLKPSVVSTLVANVEIWNPLVNSGLGVMAKAKFFYPFSGKVELDLQKSPKELLVSFQPPNRPVNVFTFETRPFTYTFFWPESLRTLAEPEVVTVMGEDFTRVTKFNKAFGEHVLGIKMNVRGFFHRTPFVQLPDTPFCPLSGPNKFVFSTEPGFQMPKEFFLKLTGDFFMPFTEELKPEFREFPVFAESIEEFNLQSMRSFVPKDPSQHKLVLEVFTKDAAHPRRLFLESFLKCGAHMKFCKFFTQIERTPVPRLETQPFKLCFVGETMFPETPLKFSDLVGKKAVAQFQLNWGQSCESDKFIRLNILGERSQQQIQHERISPEFRFFSEPSEDMTINGPVFQYEHLYKFAHLLEYKFDLQFNQVPLVVKKFANLCFRFLKHQYYYQTDVCQINVRNPQNQVQGFLTIDPSNRQYFNVSVQTPLENAFFKDIPIKTPIALAPFNIRKTKPFLSVFDDVFPVSPFNARPTCHVSSKYIKTFDQVKYTVPFSDCWTVLAKDCASSEQPRFGVYLQRLRQDSDLKKIKIVTQYHRFFLVPESDSYETVKIEFDGQKFLPDQFETVRDHGHVIAKVEKIGNYVVFVLPESGIKVFFDGYSVNIKMSHLYRNIQCGLCGHFDFEPQDEFRLPSNELTQDVRHFYRSFLLNDESCTIPEIDEVCSTPRCEPFTTTPAFCPVCKHVFREISRRSSVKKNQVRRLFERFCEEFPAVQQRCIRFFESKLDEFFMKFQQDKTESEVCKFIDACPNLDFFQSESFRSYPQLEFHKFESSFPVLRTKVIEQNHQLCFSKEPVPVCPHHSFARSFKPEKRVVFCCLHRDDPQAELFIHRAIGNFEVLPEIRNLPASFTETVLFPEACSSL
jgi:hypothetical protein